MGEGDREVERIMMVNVILQVKFQLHVSHVPTRQTLWRGGHHL